MPQSSVKVGRRPPGRPEKQDLRSKVTPDRAEELLALNTHNRNLDKARCKRYATDMLEDRWLSTHEPITIDWFGRINNGQHRLEAVKLSGVTCYFDIWWNVDPATQAVIDIPGVRNLADALRLNDYQEPSYMARIASLLYQYSQPWEPDSGKVHPVWLGRSRVSLPELLEFAVSYPLIQNAAIWVGTTKYVRNMYSSPAIPGAALCLLATEKRAEEFFTRMRDAQFGATACPIKALTQTLAGWRLSKNPTAIDTHTLTGAKLVFTGRIFENFKRNRPVIQGKKPSKGAWCELFTDEWQVMSTAWFSPVTGRRK